jgi:hypothetical protein
MQPQRAAAARSGDARRDLGQRIDDAQLTSAEAEHSECAIDRVVTLGADEDLDGRRAGQAVFVDVPADRAQHLCARDREPDEASHLRAGHQRARTSGHLEQLGNPAQRDVLHHRSGRCRLGAARVLVPHRRQPVRCDRRRQAAADHEAEEATALHRRDARVGEPR